MVPIKEDVSNLPIDVTGWWSETKRQGKAVLCGVADSVCWPRIRARRVYDETWICMIPASLNHAANKNVL